VFAILSQVTVLAPFVIHTFRAPAHQLALSSFLFRDLIEDFTEDEVKASLRTRKDVDVRKADVDSGEATEFTTETFNTAALFEMTSDQLLDVRPPPPF
jgi:hypothetical protein